MKCNKTNANSVQILHLNLSGESGLTGDRHHRLKHVRSGLGSQRGRG